MDPIGSIGQLTDYDPIIGTEIVIVDIKPIMMHQSVVTTIKFK
jgi:hypothetical protein